MYTIYQNILQLVKVKEGFEFEAYKLPMLIRRIDNRILKKNSATPENYYSILQSDEKESRRLVNNFLINVSHFFRDPFTFEFIKKKVLPELIARSISAGQNSFRIWSAGCANGEEAYSLAILIEEYCRKENLKIEVDFFATDYDSTALVCARKGEYNPKSLEEVKLKYFTQYFTQSAEMYRINADVKSKIQFLQYNLLDRNSYAPSESVFGEFDLILCRNVLIYFNEEFQNLIFNKLYKSLSKNKILVLGDAEVPPTDCKRKFQQINDCCKIYRKVDHEN